jgi:hypothetical protein
MLKRRLKSPSCDGGATFFGRPTDQELDLVPPKQLGRVAQIARVMALGLLLVMVPGIGARADQAPLMTRALPMSTATAQTAPQCCRMCKRASPSRSCPKNATEAGASSGRLRERSSGRFVIGHP